MDGWLTVKIIGSKPCPRVLVWGIEADSELGVFISKVAPTFKFVASNIDLKLIRLAEWDAVILHGDPPTNPSLHGNIKAIQFGGPSITGYFSTNPYSWNNVGAIVGSVATEFSIPDGVPDGVHELILKSLLPLLQSELAHYIIKQDNVNGFQFAVQDVIEPFIVDADGHPLAGRVLLPGREWWWLPDETSNKEMWIAAAFSEWSKTDPDKFPPDPIWVERPQWQTKAEREAISSLTSLREERARVLADLDKRELELVQQYEGMRREADQRERRLLTAQGNDLVQEVQAALEEIGFKVQDVDVEQAPKGTLLEDLRIEDAEASDWIALAEVRGYTGGAKVSDLQRIGRFVEHYIRAEKKGPSARWYIVNHNLKMDPSARPPVLGGGAEDVAIFEDAGGLIIDTRVLFTIREQVRTGAVERAAARQSIRDAKGILRYPEQENS